MLAAPGSARRLQGRRRRLGQLGSSLALLVLTCVCLNSHHIARGLIDYFLPTPPELIAALAPDAPRPPVTDVDKARPPAVSNGTAPPPTRRPEPVVDLDDLRTSGVYILTTLRPRIKRAIDRFRKLPTTSPNYGERWPSCAVVGNSGALLNADYGHNISQHSAVWRINLAPQHPFERHVGHRTAVSFINGHRLNWCANQEGCPCIFYGEHVPFIISLWEKFHWDNLRYCKQQNPTAKFLVIDEAVKELCARVVDAYAQQKHAHDAPTPAPPGPKKRHVRPDFSTGMEAVTVAITLCSEVSIYGFGTEGIKQHHYWENETKHEYGLHIGGVACTTDDYAAERLYFRDLAEGKPPLILGGRIKIPKVRFIA